LNVTVPLLPGSSLSLAKPRSCFGGVGGADEGRVTYSCATSAPATEPVLVMVAVTVATVSQRSEGPPGMVAPVAGPAVAVEVVWRAV
jgi:hypothetical protein